MVTLEELKKDELTQAHQLYALAFPDEERAPWPVLVKRARDNVDWLSIYKNGQWAGFLYVCKYEDLHYIFYFAVSEEFRGQGVGTEAVKALMERWPGERLFLAAEEMDDTAPNWEQRRRRKSFYLKAGFKELGMLIKEGPVIFEALGVGGPVKPREYFLLMFNWAGGRLGKRPPVAMFRPELRAKHEAMDKKASLAYKAVERVYGLARVSKMLDKEGEAWDKLLWSYAEKQKKPLRPPMDKLRPDFSVGKGTVGGRDCFAVWKKGDRPKKAILYLFGGSYIMPPDPADLVLCAQMAQACDAQVWFPVYPLAPEHRYRETLTCVLQVYEYMLERYEPENISVFGASSGGGLALSLCMLLKQERPDLPLPARLCLQSPGVQVPPSPEQYKRMEHLAKHDVQVPPAFFKRIAPMLAQGEDAALLSPILSDLTGFPEINVFYGTHEVSYAYLPDLESACKKNGVKLRTHIGYDMMHCWGSLELLPEARQVRKEYFEALKT